MTTRLSRCGTPSWPQRNESGLAAQQSRRDLRYIPQARRSLAQRVPWREPRKPRGSAPEARLRCGKATRSRTWQHLRALPRRAVPSALSTRNPEESESPDAYPSEAGALWERVEEDAPPLRRHGHYDSPRTPCVSRPSTRMKERFCARSGWGRALRRVLAGSSYRSASAGARFSALCPLVFV